MHPARGASSPWICAPLHELNPSLLLAHLSCLHFPDMLPRAVRLPLFSLSAFAVLYGSASKCPQGSEINESGSVYKGEASWALHSQGQTTAIAGDP